MWFFGLFDVWSLLMCTFFFVCFVYLVGGSLAVVVVLRCAWSCDTFIIFCLRRFYSSDGLGCFMELSLCFVIKTNGALTRFSLVSYFSYSCFCCMFCTLASDAHGVLPPYAGYVLSRDRMIRPRDNSPKMVPQRSG